MLEPVVNPKQIFLFGNVLVSIKKPWNIMWQLKTKVLLIS